LVDAQKRQPCSTFVHLKVIALIVVEVDSCLAALSTRPLSHQEEVQLTMVSRNNSGRSPLSVSSGAAENSTSNTSAYSFKLLLLTMMVLQNSSTVLVGRFTRAGVPESELYDVNHLIVVTELSKLILAALFEFHTTSGNLMASLHQHVFQKPMDALIIMVPSLLYLVQNTLLYVAFSNLTAPIFQVTYQGKLVTTAIVSVIMLQRRYSVQQWVCLVGLSLGVAIVVLGEKKSSGSDDSHQNLFVGLSAVTVACFCSALAGVYFEKVLKKVSSDATQEPQASLWMRNIQMAFFCCIIALLQSCFQKPANPGMPYLHGFSAWAWILVMLQAGGGMLVAAVIKYADNVLKGLATGVSVVVSSVLSMILFGTPLGIQFNMGAVVILTSVYFFSNPLPTFGKIKDDTESKDLLPK
jgi:UDP-sugar transporter A1/2/3